jgi:glycosyltransferase involved in cell wall biosynthesis
MRILYSHRTQSRDGQSIHIEEIVTALRQLGHEVIVVGPGLYDRAQFGSESKLLSAIRARLPRALLELAEIAYNVPAVLRLWRACQSFRPDLIYERYNLYFLAGTMLSRRHSVPLFLEVNAPVCEERARYGGLALQRLAGWLQRYTWRSADRTFVVTEVLKQLVVAAGVPRERVSVVPNAIDAGMFPAVPYSSQPGRAVTIGFIGFIRDWHGLDQVIDGLCANDLGAPVRFIVAGDGPARARLEQKAADLGVSPLVQFVGLQPRSAIPEFIRQFDIALQPSAVGYASPLKLFEYMACGRAIVAPDQPNIREVLRHDQTALLFEPDDPAALWRAIRRLAGDPALRERLGQAARRELDASGYTWRGNAARITAAAADLSHRDCAAAASGQLGSS